MIGIYRLNADGSVPHWVQDGGYFANEVGQDGPDNWELVGVLEDGSPALDLASLDDLKSYLSGIGAESWERSPYDNQADIYETATDWWRQRH